MNSGNGNAAIAARRDRALFKAHHDEAVIIVKAALHFPGHALNVGARYFAARVHFQRFLVIYPGVVVLAPALAEGPDR